MLGKSPYQRFSWTELFDFFDRNFDHNGQPLATPLPSAPLAPYKIRGPEAVEEINAIIAAKNNPKMGLIQSIPSQAMKKKSDAIKITQGNPVEVNVHHVATRINSHPTVNTVPSTTHI